MNVLITEMPRRSATYPRRGTDTTEVSMRWNLTAEERFWSKVNRDGPTPTGRVDLGECWEWTASTSLNGYGQFFIDGHLIRAHHYLLGKPPAGFVTDHLCRNRLCVRPSHLEFVTHRENILRGEGPKLLVLHHKNSNKTHCPAGHEYNSENTWIEKTGARHCRLCGREKRRKARG